MPEGPEIRQAADALAEVLKGQVIVAAELQHEALHAAAPYIVGSLVEDVDCHGKALLTRFSSGKTLYSHNQLYGVWRVSRRGLEPKTNRALRLALHTENHSARLYSATDISLWNHEELYQHPFLQTLGPDVLAGGTTASVVVDQLMDPRFRNRQLSALYLDQKFMAGIGNYLRAEILYFARIHPSPKPSQLDKAALARLARNTLIISRRSYRTGGITLPSRLAKTAASVKKRRGKRYESNRFGVFARAGRGCYQCGSRIQKAEMNSRRIYWCPQCQPTPD